MEEMRYCLVILTGLVGVSWYRGSQLERRLERLEAKSDELRAKTDKIDKFQFGQYRALDRLGAVWGSKKGGAEKKKDTLHKRTSA